MEDTLRELTNGEKTIERMCLNPYYNGRYSPRIAKTWQKELGNES